MFFYDFNDCMCNRCIFIHNINMTMIEGNRRVLRNGYINLDILRK